MTAPEQPRRRLTRLLLYLRRGRQIRIALQARCSPSTVSAVLNGRTAQDTDLARNIIRLAEHYVHRNNFYRRNDKKSSWPSLHYK